MRQLVVVVVVMVVAIAALQVEGAGGSLRAVPGREGEAGGEGERRLCGWKLADELKRVGKGLYNKPTVTTNTNTLFYRRQRGEDVVNAWTLQSGLIFPPRSRESPAGALMSDILPYHEGVVPPVGGDRLPLLSGAEAWQVVGRSRRDKRGLSAECCRKACTTMELAGYCY